MNYIRHFIKERSLPFLQENGKLIAQFVITTLFIGLAIWFIKNERAELGNVKSVLFQANGWWIFAGIAVVLIYILLQGLMYVSSFASVHTQLRLWDAIILFLKRNFISVFLPAGGVSSLAFYTKEIEKKGIDKTQIYFASSIYGFVGILSVVIVAIPAFILAMARGTIGQSEWIALFAVILLIAFIYLLYRAVINHGRMYDWLVKFFPKTEVFLNELQNRQTNRKQFIYTVIYSVIIEFVGIAHVLIAMIALHFEPSIFTAVMSYLIMVIFLNISPFLRGLGAIEVSMTYVLIRSGFSNVDSIAIMILFRFFEFWMPLFAGIISFLLKIDKLLMRILPSLLLLLLGLVNIISVLTPALSDRLAVLKEIILPDVIYSSNMLVLITGLFLLVTAVFMLKGLRTAWWFAFVLTLISFIGHITKGIDVEEATIALLVLIILLSTRKEYYVKTNPKLRNIGFQTALLTMGAVLLYGIIGFFFLHTKHFHIDFSLVQSIRYTIQNYFLVGSSDLVSHSNFARDFIYSIKGSGLFSLTFLIYTFIRPFVFRIEPTIEELEKANDFMKQAGKSALDYFKTYFDKLFFWSSTNDAFIAYRVSGNYAVVLENPVAGSTEAMKRCIEEFGRYCYESGLKEMYYRVPEESLSIYKDLKKKSLFLGQEGVVDVSEFSLDGRDMKSIRNAVRKVADQGYKTTIHQPPLLDGTLQKLKAVSDEWLKSTGRDEIIFSQGLFDEKEIKQQTVLAVENHEEKIIAFVNIIPDFAPNEGTYDLIRKTNDAPNGIMDYILIELFNYFKSQNIRYVNIGFAPMSGLNDPHTFPEKSMKFAYEKIRSFSHYKGQRDYKEKFKPIWHDKFLIYTHDYDLLQAPGVLSKVIKT